MDKKSREIFYGVVIIATLIIAIVGTTLAYFTYFTSSEDEAVKAHAAMVDIEYSDGNQVTAQADELIPSSLDVVKKVYEKYIADKGTDAPTDNACIDSKGRQVCSVYRFSIRSDIAVETYALLNNEYNGFTYLAYAVKDVTNNKWLTMLPNASANNQFVKMYKCSNDNEKSDDDCYKIKNDKKVYNTNPEANNSIFGYGANGKLNNQLISANEHVYDLVLFVYENNKDQNIDQGKKYLGTINIEATNDIDAIITGK